MYVTNNFLKNHSWPGSGGIFVFCEKVTALGGTLSTTHTTWSKAIGSIEPLIHRSFPKYLGLGSSLTVQLRWKLMVFTGCPAESEFWKTQWDCSMGWSEQCESCYPYLRPGVRKLWPISQSLLPALVNKVFFEHSHVYSRFHIIMAEPRPQQIVCKQYSYLLLCGPLRKFTRTPDDIIKGIHTANQENPAD